MLACYDWMLQTRKESRQNCWTVRLERYRERLDSLCSQPEVWLLYDLKVFLLYCEQVRRSLVCVGMALMRSASGQALHRLVGQSVEVSHHYLRYCSRSVCIALSEQA